MPRSSNIQELAEKRGAEFKEWFGVNLPHTFKDFPSEVTAARRESAWFDQSFRSIIEVAGADAVSLIDRISSNDIKNLRVGQSVQTGFLNAQAKVLAAAYVLRKEKSLWLETQADLEEKLKNYIDKFVFVEDVKITDRSGEWASLGIEGAGARKVLEQIGIVSPPKNETHFEIELGGILLTIFSRSWSVYGESGFSTFLAKEHLAAFLEKLDAEGGRIEWAGMKTLNLLRIEKGIPWYGMDMDESYLLPETGLEKAVSYNKGCYTGQEIVARIKSRGQLKRKLTRLTIDTAIAPKPNSEIIFGNAQVGHITSAELDPEKGAVLALGYLKTEHLDPDKQFTIDGSKAVVT
ncbi:MAG: aminomethyl transferase family protein [Candidatus Omnitrophica bacterium]|nr:aminomethyl transferase family protein [Candidatus Omnitrophota bacterium]